MLKKLFPDIRFRSDEKELMDLPDVDIKKLLRTIRQFKILNILFSGSRRLMRRRFFSIMEKDPSREYSLLDIGAGGGDIAVWAAREARKRGIKLLITAMDSDPRIYPAAQEAVKEYPEIQWVVGSALEIQKYGPFDFIFSNHFLHHLDWNSMNEILRRVIENTREAYIMNDLKRSWWAYIGYTIFTGLFIRRSLAFFDGRLSILRGFLPHELNEFIRARQLSQAVQVEESFPFRIFLYGRK